MMQYIFWNVVHHLYLLPIALLNPRQQMSPGLFPESKLKIYKGNLCLCLRGFCIFNAEIKLAQITIINF